jgi:hypothetical protein
MLVARNFSMARSFLNKKKNEIFAACLSRNFTGWGKTTSERFKRKFEQQGDQAKFSSKRAEVFFTPPCTTQHSYAKNCLN